MVDLEQSIAEWRKQMFVAGIQTPVPLEELEMHLREEIERQMKSGWNEQRAFEIAAGEIGQGNMLKSEFKKVGLDKAQRRKVAGYFHSVILGFYTLALAYAMSKYNLSTNEWLSGPGRADNLAWPGLFCLASCAAMVSAHYLPACPIRRRPDWWHFRRDLVFDICESDFTALRLHDRPAHGGGFVGDGSNARFAHHGDLGA
jgi:hypothetical protein